MYTLGHGKPQGRLCLGVASLVEAINLGKDPLDAQIPGALPDAGLRVDEVDDLGGGGRDFGTSSEQGDLLREGQTRPAPPPTRSGGRRGERPRDYATLQDHLHELPSIFFEAVGPWVAAHPEGVVTRPDSPLRGTPLADPQCSAEDHEWEYAHDLVFRDLYADRSRPPDKRQYDTGAWLGVEFADLIDQQARGQAERAHRETLRAIKARGRLLALTDEQIENLIGEKVE